MFGYDEKLVFENEKTKWYTNNMTKSLKEYLINDDIVKKTNQKPIIINYLEPFWVESKDKSFNNFILFDTRTNEIFKESGFEGMCYYIDAYRLSLRSEK